MSEVKSAKSMRIQTKDKDKNPPKTTLRAEINNTRRRVRLPKNSSAKK